MTAHSAFLVLGHLLGVPEVVAIPLESITTRYIDGAILDGIIIIVESFVERAIQPSHVIRTRYFSSSIHARIAMNVNHGSHSI